MSPGRSGSHEHVVLVGMMGAGKTTVGRMLARRLDAAFLDSDEVVEARTGRTVAQIFASEGEESFRAHESEALSEMLGSPSPSVVAAAGGAVLAPANRSLMRRAGTVVWLRADPTVLASRTRPGGHRPLLADDAEGTLSRLAAERAPLYEEVSDAVVDVDRMSPESVVDEIVGLARERAS